MALNALLVVIMLGAVAEAFCALGAASMAVAAAGGADRAVVSSMLRRRAALLCSVAALLFIRLAV